MPKATVRATVKATANGKGKDNSVIDRLLPLCQEHALKVNVKHISTYGCWLLAQKSHCIECKAQAVRGSSIRSFAHPQTNSCSQSIRRKHGLIKQFRS